MKATGDVIEVVEKISCNFPLLCVAYVATDAILSLELMIVCWIRSKISVKKLRQISVKKLRQISVKKLRQIAVKKLRQNAVKKKYFARVSFYQNAMMVLKQNSVVLRQNAVVLRQNAVVLRQNAAVLRQNAVVLRQNATKS
ncbi:hypothetical protein Tco_1125195 [Tanacetum coccineum]|uniref:Uncharacterized protein n=1 Tax=Tanacetum coccineum TaxID=301880 RepID=A0ABQ5JA21_9ASTR